jgi:hypothetical protein
MARKIERIQYGGWPNCFRVSNGKIELIVTGDVGPRIIRLGFDGGRNFFHEVRDDLGGSGEPDFRLRGGHRVWAAPENLLTSWAPDNSAVEVAIRAGVLEATAPVEPATRLQKQLVIRMAAGAARVEVVHRIRNANPWAVEVSAWAMSVMAPGGVAITGFPPRGEHPQALQPTNPLVMWAYTDFSDPRWAFCKKYLLLRQDPERPAPLKVGLFNPRTWAAYMLGSDLFLKQAQADPLQPYPDFGSSLEMFTNGDMLELETLGPLVKLAPNAWTEHTEHWSLHRNVSASNEGEIEKLIEPLLGDPFDFYRAVEGKLAPA